MATDNPVSPFVLGRPKDPDFGSKENLLLVRKWISTCAMGECSNCEPAEEPALPFRVIDVWPTGQNPSDIVRLHISSPGERGQYVTLSYCWGHGQTFVTNSGTLEAMKISIRISQDLPTTLQDAIYMTRELGFR
jgi:hypothetical protein